MWTHIDLSSPEFKIKQYPSIDITKLICAILVIAIHTNPLRSVNKYLDYGLVEYLSRLAVPFFFVSSGYFCFRKTSVNDFEKEIPIAYVKKVILLYIVWNAIYLPQTAFYAFTHENGIIYGIFFNAWKLLVNGYHHLWYLLATAIAITIVTFLIVLKVKVKNILLIGGALYIIGLLGQSYFGLLSPLQDTFFWDVLKIYETIFFTTRNGLFEGVLFIGIGALFAYKKVEIKKCVAIGGLIISMVCLLIEAFTVKYWELLRSSDIYIFLVPATFFVFYIVSHIHIKESAFSKKARTYSSLMYFTHAWINFPIINIIEKIVERLQGGDYTMHSLLRFTIVTLGAFYVSFFVIQLKNKKNFKWLRKIY